MRANLQSAAGVLFDDSPHYLDHLAPLCSLLDWPLVICEPVILEAARKFYPNLCVIEAPSALGLGFSLSQQFDRIVSCSPRPLLKAALGSFSFEPLWLPHGNSNKGQLVSYFPALLHETTLLIYGQKMEDFLRSGGVFDHHPQTIRVGSYRKLYFESNRAFYDALAPNISFKWPNQPTLLYTPTWEDAEGNCTFWQAIETLHSSLPSSINLLVKPHPNTLLKDAPRIEKLIGKLSSPHVQFLTDPFPIYPLLSRCSALLSDRSSIGYDFLHFDKPLFFLDPHDLPKGRDLLTCGQLVRPNEVFQCDWQKSGALFARKRRRMASYAFDNVLLEDLRQSLIRTAKRGENQHGTQIL